jgi:exopolyphosphatase / guanosine-5'-triphosphate,3'-diphosphate pyrophosphatase
MQTVFASIDIGSNAVRLLFSNVYQNSLSNIIAEKATLVRIPVRLGMDVFETGTISDYRKSLLIKTMQAFQLLIEVYKPAGYRACATAAMREASNSAEVIEAIRAASGIHIEIIDGQEEARLISTCNNFIQNPAIRYSLYIDVGGGSTEISLFDRKQFVASESFKIGTIRLLNNKVEPEAWDAMKSWIKTNLPVREKMHCIGSGGNINKLVKLFGDSTSGDITRKKLKSAYLTLLNTPLEARTDQFGMRQDRADVIVPAADIFLKIMKWSRINRVVAPKFGLADGLAISQYNDYLHGGQAQSSCQPEKGH